MNVHVPEAGEEKFSGSVDGASGFGDPCLCSGPDGGDAAALDKNRLIGLRQVSATIDESDVCNRKLRRRFCQRKIRNHKESGQQWEKYLSILQREPTFRATGQF